jgi:hypothetical protein
MRSIPRKELESMRTNKANLSLNASKIKLIDFSLLSEILKWILSIWIVEFG